MTTHTLKPNFDSEIQSVKDKNTGEYNHFNDPYYATKEMSLEKIEQVIGTLENNQKNLKDGIKNEIRKKTLFLR